MKSQTLFSRKNKKKHINLLSAAFAHREVKVKVTFISIAEIYLYIYKYIYIYIFFFFSLKRRQHYRSILLDIFFFNPYHTE